MTAISSLANSLNVYSETFRYLQRSKDEDASIEQLKHQWSEKIFSLLGVELEVVGEVSDRKSILFVGNHISYLDIPLLFNTVNGVAFVAKNEIGSWPLFGAAARKTGTVFVKRECGGSRKLAREAIYEALARGQRIALFPSGTTSVSEGKAWRKGVFEIAHEKDVFIQPFRISYSPLRAVAYIDDDFFPLHLGRLFGHKKIQAKIEFHEPVKIQDPEKDCQYWNRWAQQAVLG